MSTKIKEYLDDVVNVIEYLGTVLDSNPTPEKTKLLEDVVDAIFTEERLLDDDKGTIIYAQHFDDEDIMYMLNHLVEKAVIPCGTFQIIAGVIVKHVEY